MTDLNLYTNPDNNDQPANVAGLRIIDLDGDFVVDSRLVAKRLDIDHENNTDTREAQYFSAER